MNINYFIWDDLDEKTKHRLMRRVHGDAFSVFERIQPIIGDIRFNGDAALVTYALKHNKAEITKDQIQVSEDEFAAARHLLDEDVMKAIIECAGNVRAFHQEQLQHIEKEWMAEISPGILAGEKLTPIASVGIYVPSGTHNYPSNTYMLAMPAIMAGVSDVIIVTPPRPDGSVDPAVLFAAEYCGVKKVYKASGAQAIAAMAYGTQTIPKVDKVVGQLGPFGTAAKLMLGNIIDSGAPCGSNEVGILCDHAADRHNLLLDLMCELEHGADSSGYLITHDETIAEYVKLNLPSYITELPMPQREDIHKIMETNGAIILTKSLEQSIEVCNDMALGRVIVRTESSADVAAHIFNAGEILLGEYTSSALSGYALGVNHTIPTSGMAKSHSTTSILDFFKRTSIGRATKAGFEGIKASAIKVVEYEGFEVHKNALDKRHHND